MDNYNPIPADVLEAWAELRDRIHAHGWSVTAPLIHAEPDSLAEGDDRQIRDSNGEPTHVSRYWPSCGHAPGEIIICCKVTR